MREPTLRAETRRPLVIPSHRSLRRISGWRLPSRVLPFEMGRPSNIQLCWFLPVLGMFWKLLVRFSMVFQLLCFLFSATRISWFFPFPAIWFFHYFFRSFFLDSYKIWTFQIWTISYSNNFRIEQFQIWAIQIWTILELNNFKFEQFLVRTISNLNKFFNLNIFDFEQF
jgi:hypothetical protein